MYCINCGTDAGEANFCPNCGTNLLGVKQNENVQTFNLITAYKSMFKKYAKFNGRSRRSEYWLAFAMNFIIFVAPIFIMSILIMIIDITNTIELTDELAVLTSGIGGLWIVAYAIAVFIPSLALTVRRLHDTGKSGLFCLLNLIPYIGIIIVFTLCTLDSQPNSNQYGPNPKGL